MREKILNSKRIVIKAGTSILTTSRGRFSKKSLAQLGDEIKVLLKMRREIVVVSSGAIGLGMEVLRRKRRPAKMNELQACAAVGQGKLMHAFENFFSKSRLHTAQLLLTRDGMEDRPRFLRARQTLETLLRMGMIPIVNENDTVATEEIAFGDNDILSVQVANLIHADLLVLLSDVDGFFLKDGSRIRHVASRDEIEKDLVKHLKDARKERTVGGMKAKLAAADMAMRLGIPLLIVNGHDANVLQKVLAGEDVGTLFLPGNEKRSARKKWIAFSAPRSGAVVVDQGAYDALAGGKRSLLARGIVGARGDFERGSVVELESSEGKVFGRGLTRYSSKELGQVFGRKTAEIEAILGYKCRDEVIHRNDLVVWD